MVILFSMTGKHQVTIRLPSSGSYLFLVPLDLAVGQSVSFTIEDGRVNLGVVLGMGDLDHPSDQYGLFNQSGFCIIR